MPKTYYENLETANQTTPTLNQISALFRAIDNDEAITKHLKCSSNDLYDVLSHITIKQYRYIYYLLFNGKKIKLVKLLNDLIVKFKN